MSNQDKKFYIPVDGKLIEVTEEVAPTYANALADALQGDSLKQMTDAVKLVEQGCGIDGLLFTITYVDMNDVVVYTCNINNAGIVEE